LNYIYEKNVQDWLHFIRHQETIPILKLLPDGSKILEIGGGDGYIASLFSKNGHVVTSTDIVPRYPSLFPVQEMSADDLAFSNNTFDIIFSSNVLEHIKELQPVFKEFKRVAKEDALFIFVLPTPAWRLISSFWYFFRLIDTSLSKIFNLFLKGTKIINKDNSLYENHVETEKIKFLYMKKIKQKILHPHGEYTSFIHEIYYFSPFRWKCLFINSGFKIKSHKRGPLFYSGESIFKFRFIKIRKFLAKYFFSSGHIYVLKTHQQEMK